LGNFEYIEADKEIYRKCITKRKQYTKSKKTPLTHRCYANWLASTIFRPNACSIFFGALFADNYLYYMEGTMGSICPQAEININKKYTEKHKN
jgi:menaquinone-dependent protoporphyrinogen IX oxidase